MDYLHTGCAALVLLTALTSCRTAEAGLEWSYTTDPLGPEKWGSRFPMCTGDNQSPINVDKTQPIKKLTPLDLIGYSKRLKDVQIVNDGHTLKLTAKGSKATISGGCLDEEVYEFESLHFHWGLNDGNGSEHTLEGIRYSMEVHIIHRNLKYSKNETSGNPDELAVLGIFYFVYQQDNKNMDSVIKAVKKIKKIETGQAVTDSITLQDFLPFQTSEFVCYRRGSLTTPGCDEVVTWTLFTDVSYLGRDQIKAFRNLKVGDSHDSPLLVDNFRPLQKRNKRVIYKYKYSQASRASAEVLGFLLLGSVGLFWQRSRI